MVPFYLKKTSGIVLFIQLIRDIIQKTLLNKFIPGVFAIFLFANNLNAKVSKVEPFNTPADAYTLPLNGSGTGVINPPGSVDYWKVTTNGDGQLNVTLSPLSGKYMYINIYDNDGVTLLLQNYSSGTFTLSQDGLAEGTYFIKVNALYNTDTSSYILSNTLTPAVVDNDIEPNNTPAEANTLAVNSTTTGHIGYYYQNRRDTFDWYKITIPEDGLLKLKLTSHNGQYIYAYLYDNNATLVLNNDYTQGTGIINTDGLAAGTYYVRINTFYNTGFAPYTLTDSLFTPAQANDNEPNNTPAEANTLAVNSTTAGHIGYYYNNIRDTFDWYKITIPEDGLFQLKLTSHNGQYIYAYLFDNNSTTVLNNTYTLGTGIINTDGLAAGTYYVRINTFYNNGFAPYTLTDSLFTPAQANDNEPNNTPEQANILTVNSTTTGHIGYYYNNRRDTFDWYKITIPEDGLFQLKLTSHNGQYIYAYLFDNNSTTVLNNTYTLGTGIINTDGLAAGTYYVRINTFYNDGFAPYTLTDSLFTYNDNDTEPNGYFSQAATLSANRTTSGHVGFYYNNVRDSVDTWKVNYTGTDGNLNLTFNILPHKIDGLITLVYFQVYKDTSGAPIFTNYFNVASTPINLTGLTQGYYYIKVFTYYSNDFSAYSINTSFQQVDIAQISLAQSSLQNSCSTGNLKYNLSGSHSPYTVNLYRDGVIFNSQTTSSDTASFTGLNDGNYYATVYGDGATDAAFSQSEITQFLPPNPTGLTTTEIGVSSAVLNWPSLSCVTNYRLQYKVTGSSTWTVVTPPTDNTNYTLSELTPYTQYTWQVASLDSANGLMSQYSDTVTFTTLSGIANIILVQSTQGNECNSNTLQYFASNSAAPYTVQLYINGNAYGSAIIVNDSASFTGLPSGNYYATATGTGSGGTLGTSATTLLTPPIPSGLVASGVSSSQETLNWNALTCATYFTLQYKLASDETWTTVNTANNNFNLTDLAANAFYVWHLAAVDSANGSVNQSSYSVTDSFKTLPPPPIAFNNFDENLRNKDGLYQNRKLNWAIFGNPISSNSMLQLQLDKKANVTIQIISIDGKVIQTINKGNTSEGTYSIPLHLGHISKGMYVVRLVVDNQVYSKKIIK